MFSGTALKLDTLVGDIEDAVSSTLNRTLRRHPSIKDLEDMRSVALRSLKSTEDVLSSVIKTHPQWAHLVSAVDHRIDRALAILRPQAIADHRAPLASLGWAPRLSSSSPDTKSSDIQNPLFTRIQRLTKGFWDSQNAGNLNEFEEGLDMDGRQDYAGKQRRSRKSRPKKRKSLDDWELPMDFL